MLIHNTACMCSLHCQYISLNVYGRSCKLFAVLHAQSVPVGFHQGMPVGLSLSFLRAFTTVPTSVTQYSRNTENTLGTVLPPFRGIRRQYGGAHARSPAQQLREERPSHSLSSSTMLYQSSTVRTSDCTIACCPMFATYSQHLQVVKIPVHTPSSLAM